MNRRPTIKRQNKKTFGARTVKKMVLEKRGSYKKRPQREMRQMRQARSR